jgi:hypothetical protein
MPLRASARPCSKQAMQFRIQTHIPCVRTHLQSLLHIAWLRSIVVLALERTSATAAADPTQCMCYVFCFFIVVLFLVFIYLFCVCLFIFLLFLVFVSLFLIV